ncbi:hypothetical protein EEF68_05460 [Neisseria gonorrhoeae]
MKPIQMFSLFLNNPLVFFLSAVLPHNSERSAVFL